MVNISKTKRNFIGLNTFICNSKCRSRCSDFTRCPSRDIISEDIRLFRQISIVWFVQYLYVRCVSAACSAKDVTAVFGNKNGKDDSFDNLVLIYCLAVREEAKSFLADVYLVLFACIWYSKPGSSSLLS